MVLNDDMLASVEAVRASMVMVAERRENEEKRPSVGTCRRTRSLIVERNELHPGLLR